MKTSQEENTTSNPTVYNRLRRYHLSCSACPPNRRENKKTHKKHGEQKPRSKNKFQ